jgi:hypothetical protein
MPTMSKLRISAWKSHEERANTIALTKALHSAAGFDLPTAKRLGDMLLINDFVVVEVAEACRGQLAAELTRAAIPFELVTEDEGS